MTKDEYIKKHFPDIDPGSRPTGNQVMIQLRTVQKTSRGGIVLVEETKDFNKGNTQVARLVKVGQIAFHDRTSGEVWKEGAWAEIGDIVLAPRYGGFRFEVPIPDRSEKAIFAVFDDTNVQLVVESNFEAFDQLL